MGLVASVRKALPVASRLKAAAFTLVAERLTLPAMIDRAGKPLLPV